MRGLVVLLIGHLISAGVTPVRADDPCAVAQHLVRAEVGLPRAAAAIDKSHRLAISIAGTGSSFLPGPGGAHRAYAGQLEATLASRLHGLDVSVVNAAKQKQTAAEMVGEFDRLLLDAKPALVVWQTGTVDAMKGVDPDEFHGALEAGVEKLQAAGADVVLMNMQYSPRTDVMIAEDVYAENMRGISLEHEVPLFDRFAVMKEWNDVGTFDLYAATKNPETAEQVHACIGRLLADFVIQAIELGRAQKEAQ